MSDKITRERPARKQRIPLGAGNVLASEQRPGYVRRFFNDKDGRIQRAMLAGYEPVHYADADLSTRGVGGEMAATNLGDTVIRKPVGGGISAVLMEIPEEFYREDQAAKQAQIDRLEEAMQPRIADGQQNSEGQYGSVQIGRD